MNEDKNQYVPQRYIELATAITITALESGNVKFENAEAVSNFYKLISTQICESALLDLPALVQQRMHRHEVSPNS